MKTKLNLLSVFCLMLITIFGSGCSTVIEPGYAGIKYSRMGEKRTVEQIPAVVGRVWYNPLTEDVIDFPTLDFRYKYGDENPATSVFTFGDSKGQNLGADVSISVSVKPDKIAYLYVTYRKTMDELIEGLIKDRIRDVITTIGSQYNGRELLGTKRPQFTDEVRTKLAKELLDSGFVLKEFAFLGPFQPPPSLVEAINASAEALEKATKAENELKETRAQSAKQVAIAKGQAESDILKAKGEAEANRILTQSITPNLITWRKMENQKLGVEKWDGKLSQVSGTSGTIVSLPGLSSPQQ